MAEKFDSIFEKGGFLFAFASFAYLLVSSGPAVTDFQKTYLSFSDVPETVAFIALFTKYGLFGNAAELGGGGYTFFGNMPPLYGLLGSLVNLALKDPVASALLVNTVLAVLVAALLLEVQNDSSAKMKALVLLFVLLDPLVGFSFPFIVRARSLLAVFFFVLILYLEKRKYGNAPAYFLCMLASFLSQPVIAILAAGLLSWKAHRMGEYTKILAMAAAFAVSLPFIYKLLLVSGAPPSQLGSSVYSLSNPYSSIGIFLVLAAFAISTNMAEKYAALAAFLFLLLPLLNTASYLATGDLDKTLFANVPFGSDLVYDAFLATCGIFLFSEYSKKVERNKLALGLLFFAIALGFLLLQVNIVPSHQNFESRMRIAEEMAEKGKHIADMYAIENKGQIRMIQGDFILPPLVLLYWENVTFANNLFPAQLDKGPVFMEMLKLVNNLAYANGSGCEESVEFLRNERIDLLVYIIDRNSVKTAESIEKEGDKCGLEKQDLGISTTPWLVAFKIRQ